MSTRIGIDTGGTFTDLVALDESSGRLSLAKQPSTPAQPAKAVFDVLARSGVDVARTAALVLGTTIGTNALIEKKGARVLYLTTQGFEDVPFIQRIDKKDPYDLQWQKPEPLVARGDCIGVCERVTRDGSVSEYPTPEELARIKKVVHERLALAGNNTAIAVNLLFSYLNSDNERLLREFLHTHFPQLPLSVSSDISPIWREYERASTTVIDAYLKPLMIAFLDDLQRQLARDDFKGAFSIMKSNGGHMLGTAATSQPVHTMLSGVSGGLLGGKFFGEKAGCTNIVTFDMGGTSTDVAMVQEGRLDYTTEYEVDFSVPVSALFLNLHTIGAGGGSVAWVDPGGMFRVGPHSSGADPGPVCYGQGGQDITVTDANVVLGRINPQFFLGGAMQLDLEAAKRKMALLGRELDLPLEETALAILELANENMANAIRVLTIEKGIDPRQFSLVAFGGAGPLHACEISEALGLQQIVIPLHPGLTSAFGALVADVRVDRKSTQYFRSNDVDLASVNRALDRLMQEAVEELRANGFGGKPILERTISMRYAGQNYERDVLVPPGKITVSGLQRLLDDFHKAHQDFYGHHFPQAVIEFIHFNATAIGESAKPYLPKLAEGSLPLPHATRAAYFRGKGYLNCGVYRRSDLPAGCALKGPAIIEEADSTTLILPEYVANVTQEGLLMVVRSRAETQPKTATVGRRDRIDSVTLAILHNHLVNITREMGTSMMRTAYSPIFSESKDFACALFDATGQMIAQGEFCPAQLGAMPHTVQWTVAEIGLESFAAGDVVIHNDPYRGGYHMPEHLMLKPVFHANKLIGFAAVIGHVAEIGAMVVGSFASDATEVFQEGLRLPPVKIMAQGEYVQDVWKVVLANHRTPDNTWGDFHAMLGSLNVGERRLMQLVGTHGRDMVSEATAELLDYSERLMRERIHTIPRGEFSAQERIEDDGITTRPYIIKATVVIDDDWVLVDYTGSDSQAQGPINVTYGATASATYNALLQVTGYIPRNAGCYRPIKIIAPPGSVVNVSYPGPSVGGNTEGQPRIVGAILRALSQAIPERVMGSEGATSCNFLFGGVHPDSGQYYVHYHFEASGWGGRSATDGNSAQNHIHGNCRNTPVEIFETLFPFLIKSYQLKADSGGAGRRRGGLGTRRVLRVQAPQITVSMMMDHVKEGAEGLFGGGTGGLAGIWIKRKGEQDFVTFVEAFGVVSPSKFAKVTLCEGDEIIIDSAGGGGYGNPAEREPELVLNDVAAGFVSIEAAEHEYGVKIVDSSPASPNKYAIDETATAALRSTCG